MSAVVLSTSQRELARTKPKRNKTLWAIDSVAGQRNGCTLHTARTSSSGPSTHPKEVSLESPSVSSRRRTRCGACRGTRSSAHSLRQLILCRCCLLSKGTLDLSTKEEEEEKEGLFLSFFLSRCTLVGDQSATDGDARSAPFWCRRNTDDGDGPSAERESGCCCAAGDGGGGGGGRATAEATAGGRAFGRTRARALPVARENGGGKKPSVRSSVRPTAFHTIFCCRG